MPKQLKEISVSHLCPNCGKGLLPNKFRKGFVWCPNYKVCGLKTRRAAASSVKAQEGEIAPLNSPSDEQQAIFDAVAHTDTHLLIEALAGTGKTTVLVQIVRILAEQGDSVLALSFSRRDKDALMGKCFDKAKIMTSNGAGMGILSTAARANKKSLQISDDLAFRTLRQRWIDDGLIVKGGNGEGKDKWEMSAHILNCVLQLVDKARGTLPMNVNGKKEPTEQDWQDLCERFNIEIKAEHWATTLFYCQVMFTQLSSLKFALNVGIDLTGQIFLPVYHNLSPTTQYDKVLVDEAQDQSYYTRMIAALYLKPNGKIIACGDKHQAIYSWRGADSNSLGEMQKLMLTRSTGEVQTFPLTLCRRCPDSVISQAQCLVPSIRGLGKDVGVVSHIKEDADFVAHLMKERKGYVICRTNAPSLKMCLMLLAQGVPAMMCRSNVVSELINMVDTFAGVTGDECEIPEVLHEAGEYMHEKRVKMSGKMNAAKVLQQLEDKMECVKALAQYRGVKCAGELKDLIDKLFPANIEPNHDKLVVFTTVHGAKGGEADNVYLYAPVNEKNLCLWDAAWGEDFSDRDNVLYVALTRSRMTLTWVGLVAKMERLSSL